MELKIAVCDDEPNTLEQEIALLDSICREKNISHTISKYLSPTELLAQCERYNLAVLDIEMDDMDGIMLARKIAERNGNCFIIFITNYPFYLDRAFDVNAVRYLSKPIDRERLSDGIDSVTERIEASTKRLRVTRLTTKLETDIEISTIIYIVNTGRHTNIISTTYDEFEVEEIFSKVKNMIETEVNYFCQPHQSFYVNLKYVAHYTKNEVIMSYGQNTYEAIMTKRRYKAFDKQFFNMANKIR